MSTVFSVSTKSCPPSFSTYINYVALEAAFEQQSFMPVLNSHHKKVALTNHLLLSARGLNLVYVVIKGDCVSRAVHKFVILLIILLNCTCLFAMKLVNDKITAACRTKHVSRPRHYILNEQRN